MCMLALVCVCERAIWKACVYAETFFMICCLFVMICYDLCNDEDDDDVDDDDDAIIFKLKSFIV